MSGLSYMKTDFIGLDCEMVGVGPNGDQSSLARCCLVDYDGNVIYDKFVKPKGFVTDFRTRYSGIHKWDLRNAIPFEQCQAEVAQFITAKILVGHALKNDLDALMLTHPRALTRDTAMYRPYMKNPVEDGGKFRMRGLKELAAQFLGLNIQVGEHDPGEDARTAMLLYRLKQNDWEKFVARMLARSQDPDVRLQAQQQLLQLSANPNVAVHELPKSLSYMAQPVPGRATHNINGYPYALRSSNGSPPPPTFVPTVYLEPPKTINQNQSMQQQQHRSSPPLSPVLQSIGLAAPRSAYQSNNLASAPEFLPRRLLHQPATGNMTSISGAGAGSMAGSMSGSMADSGSFSAAMAIHRGAAPLPRPPVHNNASVSSSAMNNYYNTLPSMQSYVHELSSMSVRTRSISPSTIPPPPITFNNSPSYTVPARATSNANTIPAAAGTVTRDDDLDFSLLEAEWENNCKYLQQLSVDFNSQATAKNGLQYSTVFGHTSVA